MCRFLHKCCCERLPISKIFCNCIIHCTCRSKGGRTAKNVQRFVYDEGYIACHCDLNLVLAVVSSGDGQTTEVALVKRKKDDLGQLWVVKPNG